jgi:hypothetical protein
MKKVFVVLIILASLVIIRGFYLPWATVETSVLKGAAAMMGDPKGKIVQVPRLRRALKEAAGFFYPIVKTADKEIKVVVTGRSIPRMMQGKDARVVISFMEILFKDIDNVEERAYLVYIIPIGALLCILFSLLGLKFRLPLILMLMLTEAIGIIGLYNLKTTFIDARMPEANAHLSIGFGIWYTVYAYLFIFLASFLWLVFDKRR